ncbi:MAG: transposase [Paludibacteraceae bacterium]|nr:transposase [Paludibacteraceae bacterium]
MSEIKCPSCGSTNVVQIDSEKFQCSNCGNTFTTNSVTTVQQPQQPDFKH